jgi:hypothetical protein
MMLQALARRACRLRRSAKPSSASSIRDCSVPLGAARRPGESPSGRIELHSAALRGPSTLSAAPR